MPGKSPASRDPDEGHPLLSGCRNRVLHLTTSFVPGVISWTEQALIPDFKSAKAGIHSIQIDGLEHTQVDGQLNLSTCEHLRVAARLDGARSCTHIDHERRSTSIEIIQLELTEHCLVFSLLDEGHVPHVALGRAVLDLR